MYQATISSFTEVPVRDLIHTEFVDFYEDLTSLGVTFVDGEYLACRLVGLNTNFTRSCNFVPYVVGDYYPYPRNSRYWKTQLRIFATGNNGITNVDQDFPYRREGNVFLSSPEIYLMTWYINPDYADLDYNNWTPIGLTTTLNLQRTVDDPYKSAPVTQYEEYTDNDVSSSTNNTNIQYGTQTG